MASRSLPLTLRWVCVMLIQEYARRNGHADFLRERTDGATGDWFRSSTRSSWRGSHHGAGGSCTASARRPDCSCGGRSP
ncbi:DUF664 domain-containing protein [Streptomyces sp. NPDC057909]|uniref:mycothiol transferase n=1 Tax=Streptomyces sp. NPDC057909 TaxID=3346277 RepID=UPI0036E9454C